MMVVLFILLKAPSVHYLINQIKFKYNLYLEKLTDSCSKNLGKYPGLCLSKSGYLQG